MDGWDSVASSCLHWEPFCHCHECRWTFWLVWIVWLLCTKVDSCTKQSSFRGNIPPSLKNSRETRLWGLWGHLFYGVISSFIGLFCLGSFGIFCVPREHPLTLYFGGAVIQFCWAVRVLGFASGSSRSGERSPNDLSCVRRILHAGFRTQNHSDLSFGSFQKVPVSYRHLPTRTKDIAAAS